MRRRSSSIRRPSRPGTVRVFAPSSVANLGVGFDALGVALDGPGDVVSARLSRRSGVRIIAISGDGGRLPTDPEQNTAAVAAREVLALFGAPGVGIEIELEKGLPLSSGLGSSAASAAAGALAAALLLHVRDRTRLLRAVLVAERVADGSWHGDNAFPSLLGGLLLVPASSPARPRRPITLPVPERLRLVLVHPDLELPTKESRAVLPASVSLADHVAQSAAFAELIEALHRGDLRRIGRLVSSDRIIEPARRRLVRGYDAVRDAMRRAGAYGSALAGAGPSLLAVSEEGPLAEAIARAAVQAWRGEGIRATARVHRVDRLGARLFSETPIR